MFYLSYRNISFYRGFNLNSSVDFNSFHNYFCLWIVNRVLYHNYRYLKLLDKLSCVNDKYVNKIKNN